MENPNFIFTSEPVELKEEGDNFYVEGYISTSDLDLVNDIVTKSCLLDMAEQMKSRTIKLDIEHESFRGRSETDLEINKTIIPAAKIDDFMVDKKGLKVRAMLNKHISRFNEIKGSIKEGFLDAFSIAYIPVKSIMETRNGQEVRRLEKLNLLNVAFTGNPVNTEAKMINVFAKSLEFLKEQEKARSIEERRTAGRNESLRESETEDAEDEDKKKNKKKEEGKNHIHESDQLNTQEVKKMSEEETIAMKEENASEKAEKPKPKKEEDDDEEMMMKKKKNSQKSEELSEIKSELESVKKELMEVKAAIIKPVLKSRIEQQDKSQNFVESKSISPLDMIA
jgi:HK97 family phage prohead protease